MYKIEWSKRQGVRNTDTNYLVVDNLVEALIVRDGLIIHYRDSGYHTVYSDDYYRKMSKIDSNGIFNIFTVRVSEND